MRRLICLCVCLIIVLSVAGCGKKNSAETENAPISGIGTATADKDDIRDEIKPEDGSDNRSKESGENRGDTATDDRTEETDRQEIKNNLRDARELIEEGAIEDAEMILDVIRTRVLTEEEKEELLELEKLMLVVSD